MLWRYPTDVPHVTSKWDLKRVHPVTGKVKPHTGTDFRARTGTPLYAVAGGVVAVSTFDALTAGNYVRLDLGGGVWVGYSHLARRDVAKGDKVKPGQVIGLAGDTGSATAAHLHFEVSIDGAKVDPEPVLAARTTTPPPTMEADMLNPEDIKEIHGVVLRLWREPEIRQIIRDAVLNAPVARDPKRGPTTFLQDTVNGTTAALESRATLAALTAAVHALATSQGADPAAITAAAHAGARAALADLTLTARLT